MISFAMAIRNSVMPRWQWRESAQRIKAIETCDTATIAAIPHYNFEYHQGYFFRGRDVTFVPFERANFPAIMSDDCPVLLWATHMEWAAAHQQISEAGLSPEALTIFRFNNAFVVLEPGR